MPMFFVYKSSRPNEPNTEMYYQRPELIILERHGITINEFICLIEANFDNLTNSTQQDTENSATNSSLIVHNTTWSSLKFHPWVLLVKQ